MSAKKNSVTLVVAVLLAFIAIASGIFVSHYLYSKKRIDPNQFHGTYLETPREVEQFALTDVDNKPFTNDNLHGQWTMLFFGFTNCGYLCPTTMAELGKMYRLLQQEGVKPLPHIVMISIDPDRDSLEKLQHYVKAFNPQFDGATGAEDAIKKMTREMGIAYAKIALPDTNDPQKYDMQHSGAVMLFNPRGELNAFFTTPHQATLLARDYQMLLSQD
ncbi:MULTISPECIES: SCO family protein [unclassified Legionella]|uniref:SCO family protein n=1 Tax=unclassified Legionella TaxID=2622702 RepID=UPI0010564DA2|nr:MULTISPECIES: SCO family protein [unclassified Legionella]MDI9817852.1 SCO family protein [Legionella sp. PL877]